jgi:hypothetical protein
MYHVQATHTVRHLLTLLTFLTSVLATVNFALLCNSHWLAIG